MQIDLDLLRDTVIEMKDRVNGNLDRTQQNKIRDLLIAQVQILESILIWINITKKEGEISMEKLKIGVGKTVNLNEIAVPSRSQLDAAIIEEAEFLKGKEMGAARVLDKSKISNITYWKNRVYTLAHEGRIPKDTKPVIIDGELYLGLRESQRRFKRKEMVK